jgi:hydroxymethylpyrimidine/phosphomethylpyrimidine kinase
MCTKSVALTIAGFDPGSGAGITADLKTFSAHRVYGVACISALTVQSTQGVRVVEPLSPTLVRQTLECLAEDVGLAGIKIGMLGTSGIVSEVVSFLVGHSSMLARNRIVLDPVLRSTSGTLLLDANGIQELAILIGEDLGGRDRVPAAAAQLQDVAGRQGNDDLNVVVTGGDLSCPDDFLLTASGEQHWFPGEKIATNSTHGTGCAFSSALLCELISGSSAKEAVAAAKAYVTETLRSAYPVGKGKGPLNHLYQFDPGM